LPTRRRTPSIYRLGQHRSPTVADRWYRGLLAAYQTLTLFPYRYIALPRRPNVRRLLYQNWRALYTVVEPQSPGDEALVRILHVYHGAQQAASDELDEPGGAS
jgi:plasmid stabilization system protein ParE